MKFGFWLPIRGPYGTPAGITTMAQRAEAMGFGYAAVADHVIVPTKIESTYPYTDTGKWMATADCMDQLTVCAFVAACTRTIGLLPSVMVVPHRPAILAAKMLASVDKLSGGRLLIGAGTGWMAEELAVLGIPFAARGRVTDEYIRAFRELWTHDKPAFEGEYVRFKDVLFEPKPVQRPIPIWTGGEGGPAIRRAARLADGWYPIGTNPAHPFNTLPRFKEGLARLAAEAEKNNRDPKSIGVGYFNFAFQENPHILDDGQRRLMTGPAGAILDDVGRLAEVGVSVISLNFLEPALEATLDRMGRFASDVIAKVR